MQPPSPPKIAEINPGQLFEAHLQNIKITDAYKSSFSGLLSVDPGRKIAGVATTMTVEEAEAAITRLNYYDSLREDSMDTDDDYDDDNNPYVLGFFVGVAAVWLNAVCLTPTVVVLPANFSSGQQLSLPTVSTTTGSSNGATSTATTN